MLAYAVNEINRLHCLAFKSILKDTVVVLGEQIAKAGYRLVYGGSSLGLMGLLAK